MIAIDIPNKGAYHLIMLSVLLAGCTPEAPPAPPIRVAPQVRLVTADVRSILREVSQPGFIHAYEETALYAKIAGYVGEWDAEFDIGHRIKKGQVLARLAVPELVAEHQEKVEQIALDDARVKVARELIPQREAERKQAVETREYRKLRYERFVTAAAGKGIQQNLVDEENRDYQAARFAVDAAEAALSKARVDVEAAQAAAKVTRATEQRLAALLGYTAIRAPYDGIVVVRNVNTGDFVQPGTGDASGTRGTPLYVVARTDKVRVFVDVPEMDAASVSQGTRAFVRVPALDDEEIEHPVTRTSWALQVKTRTLRAEIDLPNPNARLLPGMYAVGKVSMVRSKVRALPLAAVTEIGNRNYCFLYEDGKAIQTAVQTGIDDGHWVEVTKKLLDGKWIAFTGAEKVILGDLSELSDGQAVEVVKEPPEKKQSQNGEPGA